MTAPAGVHPSADGTEVATPLSLVEWFADFYAEAQASAVPPVEGIVRAGELLFVPRGWWHLAMNLEAWPHCMRILDVWMGTFSGHCHARPHASSLLQLRMCTWTCMRRSLSDAGSYH